MKIRRVSLARFGGELARPAANARQTWSAREGLLVVVEDEHGVIGLGEASPLPGYSPDTLEACERELRALRWEALSAALELDAARDATPAATAPGEASGLARALESALARAGPRAPAARFALETALLDALAQARGVPLFSLLRPAGAPEPGPIALSALVGGESAVEETERALARGLGAVKLKIGGDLAQDLARVAELRARFGDAIAIRLDANGTLGSAESVEAALEALSRYGPELLEEPAALPAWAALRSPPLVPLAIDESLADPGALSALVRAGLCQAVVLKPTVRGGLLASLAIASAARGLDAIVTHTFEGPVALAAAASLALALPGPLRACGLDPHGGLAAWPAWPIDGLDGGSIVPSAVPGLPLCDRAALIASLGDRLQEIHPTA